MVEVPDVTEMYVPQAAAAAEAAHLVPEFTGPAEGTWVQSQSPIAGTMVQEGSTVRMHLHTGEIPWGAANALLSVSVMVFSRFPANHVCRDNHPLGG
jgi:hypothetical protein